MREELAPIIEKLRELEDMIRDLGADVPASQAPAAGVLRLQPSRANPKLRDVKWAAEYLGVAPYRIYELIRIQAIPFIRVGQSQYRFSEEAVAEWVATGGTTQEARRNGTRSSAD